MTISFVSIFTYVWITRNKSMEPLKTRQDVTPETLTTLGSHGMVPHKNRMRHRSHGMVQRPELMCPDSHVSVLPSRSGGNRHRGCGMGQFPDLSVYRRPCLQSTTGRLSAVMAPSRHPVSRPAIPVLAVTRCSEYEKKVSLWVKKKMDNDLHDNTE